MFRLRRANAPTLPRPVDEVFDEVLDEIFSDAPPAAADATDIATALAPETPSDTQTSVAPNGSYAEPPPAPDQSDSDSAAPGATREAAGTSEPALLPLDADPLDTDPLETSQITEVVEVQEFLVERSLVEDAAFVPRYFMDSPTEADRLELKTDPATVERHLRLTGLGCDGPAVDVGCGSGAISRVMARIAGPGQVTGIDASADRLAHAATRARSEGLEVHFIQARVDALPLADASSAYTHARMLFQYLADPELALAEMVRVTRPGGRIVLIDLDKQITGLHPMEEWLHAEVEEALRVLGGYHFDPEVGRKLYTWSARAGLTDLHVWVEPYQVYVGGQLASRDLANWEQKLATATAFLARVTGDARRWERFRVGYLTALTAPDAFYCANVVLVAGTIPPAAAWPPQRALTH